MIVFHFRLTKTPKPTITINERRKIIEKKLIQARLQVQQAALLQTTITIKQRTLISFKVPKQWREQVLRQRLQRQKQKQQNRLLLQRPLLVQS